MASRYDEPPTPVREILDGGGDDRRWTDTLPDAATVGAFARLHPAPLAVAVVLALLAVTWATAPSVLRPLHRDAGARAIWLSVLGGQRIVPAAEDGGVPGGIGAPAGTAVPGLRMAFMVEAGTEPVTVSPPPAGPVLRATIEDGPLRLAPGERAPVTLDVTPTDCDADPAVGEGWASLFGPDVEPAPDVIVGVARALRILCAAAPSVSIRSMPGAAGSPVPVDVGWAAPVGRVVLTPLDDDGSRGLGAVALDAPGTTALLWRDTSDRATPSRRVQVFAVVGGLAWPRVLTLVNG